MERLSRLILMLHDRSFHDDVRINHSDLASILCARRPGVTQAMHCLEGERMIANDRGCVEVLDKVALRRTASNAYGRAESEYNRMMGAFF